MAISLIFAEDSTKVPKVTEAAISLIIFSLAFPVIRIHVQRVTRPIKIIDERSIIDRTQALNDF